MVQAHHHRDDCRLCHSTEVLLVVPITPTPIADAYVPHELTSTPQPTFPLDLYQCQTCGHVQLLDVVDPAVLFRQYSYFSGRSPGLVNHFREYADEVMEYAALPTGSHIVEIGSNDGCFLRCFQDRGHRVLGIDPAENVARDANEEGIETRPEFFDLDLARRIRDERGAAAVVAANNVFAHIDQMGETADAVRHLLADGGIFIFEVSYLLDVVDHMLLGTIFHEHVCYHSVTPLDSFLTRHGLELLDVKRVTIQGGSLICTAQRQGGPRTRSQSVEQLRQLELDRGVHRPAFLQSFSQRLDAIRDEVQTLLDSLRSGGSSMAGFGAARGGTLLTYHFGLGECMEFIVDDSPDKQQLFSPGYHIPVLPTSALYERMPANVFILAWVHSKTIVQNHRKYLEQGGRFITCFPKLEVFSQ